MGVSYDRNHATTAPPTISFAAIRNALIGSVFAWSIIIGMGFIGWKLGQLV